MSGCRSRLPCMLAWALLLPIAGAAQESSPHAATALQDDEETIEQLGRILERNVGIEDVAAKFEQTRESAALRRAVRSTGSVRLREEASHWRTEEPYRYDMWVRGGEVTFYYPEDRLVEIYDLTAVMPHLVFGPKLDLESLGRQFVIGRGTTSTSEAFAVRLTPRDPDGSSLLLPMDVLVDRAHGHVRSIVTVDEQGNRTTLIFKEVRTNVGVTPENLQPRWPDDVTVQRMTVDPEDIDAPRALTPS